LLEPTYWRSRLQGMGQVGRSLTLVPRPDLSGAGIEVVEFRLRAHDGTRLWGLLARPGWHPGELPARIRMVGPAERPEVDSHALERGEADVVFQEPPGRRLEDRVLDVVRICQLAQDTEGVDRGRIHFISPTDRREPDEFLIAQQLLQFRFC
jgi:hypothetical protein